MQIKVEFRTHSAIDRGNGAGLLVFQPNGATPLRHSYTRLRQYASLRFSVLLQCHDLGIRIVLIDGKQQATLMIRYNIGCRDEEVLHLKNIDEEFFE